jgi:hypothetical protein
MKFIAYLYGIKRYLRYKMNPFHSAIEQSFDHGSLAALHFPSIKKTDNLPAWYEVTALVTASMGAASAALTRLHFAATAQNVDAQLDQRLANLWFDMTLKPLDFKIPTAWDAIAGDYQTSDGWIRLHTNAAHHKACVLNVLGCQSTRDAVTKAVKAWRGDSLENMVVNAGGCAAKMRSPQQWQQHEQGRLLVNKPLINWNYHEGHYRQGKGAFIKTKPEQSSPLAGIKVLDLTRVLAGPIASRFLAGFGAQVLRLDPQDWQEASIVAEVTLGKRCAPLDLKTGQGKQQFIALIKEADVLLHGYRADALANLGFGNDELKNINPNLINISLNAYGWKGPWENRRGFDSLVQMSCGIAHYGMLQSSANKPCPLPVQALDHASGYFLATSVIQAIELRCYHNIVTQAQCSLAATANLLQTIPRVSLSSKMAPINEQDYATAIEKTSWGSAKRIKFPVMFDRFTAHWPNGACSLRSSIASFES